MDPQNKILVGLWILPFACFFLIKGYRLFILKRKELFFPIGIGIFLNRLLKGDDAAKAFEITKRNSINFRLTGIYFLVVGGILILYVFVLFLYALGIPL